MRVETGRPWYPAAVKPFAKAAVGLLMVSACVSRTEPAMEGPAAAPVPIAHRAPAPTASMPPSAALGLWKTSFGPVKIAANDQADNPRAIMGVWVYERAGQEVIGFFTGELAGNVLSFAWHEPAGGPGAADDLTGDGYLTFNAAERRFFGRWWSRDGQLGGEWTGARPEPASANPVTLTPEDDPETASESNAATEGNVAPGPPPPRPPNAYRGRR